MDLKLSRAKNGHLLLWRNDTPVTVHAAVCFPWSHPQRYISLRDERGHEIFFVDDVNALEAASQHLLREELLQQHFLPRVLRIHSIDENMDLFVWRVTCDAGPRAFLTQRTETLRRLANGGLLIRDANHDLYLVHEPLKLDRKSLALLWVYMD